MITLALALIAVATGSFLVGRLWRSGTEQQGPLYAGRLLLQPHEGESESEPDSVTPFRPPVWAIVLVGIALWFAIDRVILLFRTPLPPSVRSLSGHVEQVTVEAGIEALPTLSPDGEWIAYRSDVNGIGDIVIRRVGEDRPRNLTHWMSAEESDPAFSPDGRRIAFRSTYQRGGIYVMDRDGGGLSRITQFGASPAWTPDGRSIVFATRSSIDPSSGAVSGDVYLPSGIRSGSSEGWIVNVGSRAVSRLSHGDFRQPSVSPDGKRIVYWAAPLPATPGASLWRRETGLWTVAIDGSDARHAVPRAGPNSVDWNPVWSPDGEFLYFLSDRGGRIGVWRAAMDLKAGTSVGRIVPMAFDAARAASLAISANGRSLAWSTAEWTPTLLRVDYDPDTRSTRGTPAAVASVGAFRCIEPSPDGTQLAGVSHQQPPDVQVVRVATGEIVPITRDEATEGCPRWSPDGTRLAFHSNAQGRTQVWVAHMDGSGRRVAVETPGEQMDPAWSPDGALLVATDRARGTNRVYALEPDGTIAARSTLPALEQGFVAAAWSPDGTKIAGTAAGAVWIYDTTFGVYTRLMPGSHPTWLSSGSRLILATEGRLILVDIPTRFTREILALPDLHLATPMLSPDDRQLYFTRNLPESNVWRATLR